MRKCGARGALEDKGGWGKGEWVGQDVVYILAWDKLCPFTL